MNRIEFLRERLDTVREEIEQAKQRAGRREEIRLVVVTKTFPVEDILLLQELGVREFGENKVQEIVRKEEAWRENTILHMIGSLQTNKVRALLPMVHCVQSLDRLSLLRELQKRATQPVDALLEVNVAEEDSKAGMAMDDIPAFLENLEKAPLVRIRGIMAMGPHTNDENAIRNAFRKTRALFEQLSERNQPQCTMEILSMGMSGDYALAIEEGSNMVRVGSAILGERNQ